MAACRGVSLVVVLARGTSSVCDSSKVTISVHPALHALRKYVKCYEL